VLTGDDFYAKLLAMYIRRTSIKSRKDGSQYFTYRLVESKRTEKGVRQHTLLNLGADFALPREQWPDLTKRIEGILGGQQSLFTIDRDIGQLAQSCALRIIFLYRPRKSRMQESPAAFHLR
jgi:hypothetical protein